MVRCIWTILSFTVALILAQSKIESECFPSAARFLMIFEYLNIYSNPLPLPSDAPFLPTKKIKKNNTDTEWKLEVWKGTEKCKMEYNIGIKIIFFKKQEHQRLSTENIRVCGRNCYRFVCFSFPKDTSCFQVICGSCSPPPTLVALSKQQPLIPSVIHFISLKSFHTNKTVLFKVIDFHKNKRSTLLGVLD